MAASSDKLAEAHKLFYDQGFKIRNEVAGPEHVQRSLQNNSSEFARPMQDLATEVGWGMIWARPGLDVGALCD
jgi:4-carboxymuconolactone decarboxylase